MAKGYRYSPFKFHMPDLSDLPVLFTATWITYSVLSAGDDDTQRAARYVFTRLVDRAIREFGEARAVFVRHEEETKDSPLRLANNGPGGLPEIFLFTDRFEGCVLTIARLLKLLRLISGDKRLGTLVPKSSRKILESQSKEFVKTRDSIVHVDERIRSSDIRKSGASFIGFDKEGKHALIFDHKLSLDQTATMLRRFHEIAVALIPTIGTTS